MAQWSPQFVAQLHDTFHELLQGDLTASSRASYASQVHQFQLFCGLRHVAPWPDPFLVAEFILGRAQQHYKLSTIVAGVSALARWAVDIGAMAFTGTPVVTRALKVAATHAVLTTRQKLPLARADLRAVVVALSAPWQPDPWRRARDRALFLLGWAGLFRSSELVALAWEHVSFFGKGLVLFVPLSKTDPGAGAWVFVAAAVDRAVCPIGALRGLQRWQPDGRGPVFRPHADSSAALSKATVGPRLRKALRAVAVPDWALYAAHSLRRGGATHAAQLGVSYRMIQVLGRWRSDAMRHYLYCCPDELWAASAQMLG